jgi:hypothetical protein
VQPPGVGVLLVRCCGQEAAGTRAARAAALPRLQEVAPPSGIVAAAAAVARGQPQQRLSHSLRLTACARWRRGAGLCCRAHASAPPELCVLDGPGRGGAPNAPRLTETPCPPLALLGRTHARHGECGPCSAPVAVGVGCLRVQGGHDGLAASAHASASAAPRWHVGWKGETEEGEGQARWSTIECGQGAPQVAGAEGRGPRNARQRKSVECALEEEGYRHTGGEGLGDSALYAGSDRWKEEDGEGWAGHLVGMFGYAVLFCRRDSNERSRST